VIYSHGYLVSAPTLGPRAFNPIAGDNLDSILLNPMMLGASTDAPAENSLRATRGDADENSSFGTSVTNTTLTATIVTATTSADSIRGRFLSLDRAEHHRATSALTQDSLDSTIVTTTTRADSIRGRYLSLDPENRRTTSALTQDDALDAPPDAEAPRPPRPPRSRSNSPFTVQSSACRIKFG
jgi:hypothetical protein